MRIKTQNFIRCANSKVFSSMQKVHILHEGYYHRNGDGFLFPLKYNYRRLLKRGISLAFYSSINANLMQCDVLCISSKFFSSWWENSSETIIDFLVKVKKDISRVIWFDITDSTGTPQFKVLPYVDRYLKNQVLKDRGAYKKVYYASRIFTDFYYRRFGIEDKISTPAHLNILPQDKDLHKIGVSWNSGMANYGYYGVVLGKIWHKIHGLMRFYPLRWQEPSLNRPSSFNCRIGDMHYRETIAFARREIKRRLAEKISVGRVSRRYYFKELSQSISSISPFGFGEICYRDFESIICGAAIVKQDMRHLETWPNLWIENETYLPFAWDFSDFQEKVDFILRFPEKMVQLARNAQDIYKNLLVTEKGNGEFCDHFAKIIFQ